jgi:dipeptidyl aminopeptidase/acylaminoacyl peptidase
LRRIVWLAVAVVLVSPVAGQIWIAFSSAAFLAEFLSEGRWRPLTTTTARVSVSPLPAADAAGVVPADLYLGASFTRAPGLVLVHGLSPDGKDDQRLRHAAALLAAAGWAVAVPTVDGLTKLRLRPDDAMAVVAAARALEQEGHRPVALLGVSLGAGPTLLAAAEPSIAASVSAVLLLGGYASAVELLRYTLTGAYRFGDESGHHPVDEAAILRFVLANPDLTDAVGRRLVENRDPGAVDRLVEALPPATQALLAALSPARVVGRIHAPLFLTHGRDDPAVPFTESLRLERVARAAGIQVKTVIVGSLAHVEPERRAGPRDLARLWAAFYAFRVQSACARVAGRWATATSSR